jgi:transposase
VPARRIWLHFASVSKSKTEELDRFLLRRRINAGRLLLSGMQQTEVARTLGVSSKSVSDWNRRLREAGGLHGLQHRPSGRPSGLDKRQRTQLARILSRGASAHGFVTELWTVRRVAQVIEEKFRRRYSQSQVWRILMSLGFSSQVPTGEELERDGAAIRRWKRVCQREQRTDDIESCP